MSTALLVMVVSPTIAQAAPITVNYSTTGVFAGCDALGGVFGVSVTCTEGNSILRYNFANAGSVLLTDAAPSASVQYGNFQVFGDAVGSGDAFTGVTFTLSLFQTSPSVGSQNLVGPVSGTVDANAGVLIWGPVAPTSWAIGSIGWTIALEQNGPAAGGVLIAPPGTGGVGGPLTTIGGTASMVPTAVPGNGPRESTSQDILGLTGGAESGRTANRGVDSQIALSCASAS